MNGSQNVLMIVVLGSVSSKTGPVPAVKLAFIACSKPVTLWPTLLEQFVGAVYSFFHPIICAVAKFTL